MQVTVKQARQMAGLTQQEMADGLEVNRSTYIKLEKEPDSITIGQARRICQITGFSIDDIFFASNSTESRV